MAAIAMNIRPSTNSGKPIEPNARITPIYQTASYVFDSAEHAANLFQAQL